MPSFGRKVIRLGTPLLLLAGFAATWAVWHVVVGRAFGPTLLIYADTAREPTVTFRGASYVFGEERPLNAYPPLLIDAVLLMEDRRFYEHHGVDLRAVMRAAWANAQHGSIVQGGSTLTQQLARSRHLTHERTFSRKIKEVVLALGMETILSKQEILERYLNDVYLGQRGTYEVRGIAAASRHYLGKGPNALRPAEVALVVGLIRSPNTTSPLVSLQRARERRDLVLRRLLEERRLSDADYHRALKEPVRVVRDSTVEGALVALDVEAGAIKAMVGGRDYQRSQFNRAVQAKRQPGSLFKPFIYLAAFEAGRVDGHEALTPATIVEDRPLALDVGNERWRPKNFNGRYYGKVRLREALERSLNAATITIGEQVGLSRVIDQARASGIESQLRSSPATLLGASEVSVLEITAAYGTLARRGEWLRPHAIRKVEDGQEGHVLFEESRDARRAASPQAVFLVTSILQGTVERGTAASAHRLGLTRDAAGKTGTSNDLRDAWFVGYTPGLIAGVWVGVDSGAPLQLTGAQAALPIWTQFIEQASVGHPPQSFEPPSGIVTAKIDPVSGLRLIPGCPGGVEEVFIQGTEPRATCSQGESALWRWVRHLFSRQIS